MMEAARAPAIPESLAEATRHQPRARAALMAALGSPGHAYIFRGPRGAGKAAAARAAQTDSARFDELRGVRSRLPGGASTEARDKPCRVERRWLASTPGPRIIAGIASIGCWWDASE